MGSGLHNELVARQYLQCSSPPKSDRPANCHATIFCCLFRIIVLSDLAAGALHQFSNGCVPGPLRNILQHDLRNDRFARQRAWQRIDSQLHVSHCPSKAAHAAAFGVLAVPVQPGWIDG